MSRIRSHGSPQEVKAWLRQTRPSESSTFELQLEDMAAGQTIGTWSTIELEPVEQWADDLCELMRSDADARGTGQYRYTLRHVVGERVKSVKSFRMVVRRESDEDAETQLDGSMLSVFQQLQRSSDAKDKQLIEMVRASVEAQKASMALLGQAYGHIQNLQRSNAELALALTESETEQASASTKRSAEDDPFRAMLETVGPHVANRVLEKLLGSDFFDEETPQQQPSGEPRKLPQ